MEIRSSLQSIEQGLSARNIHVTGISGSWGDEFNELLLSQTFSCVATGAGSQSQTLILASETIYSPETTPAFASTLFGLLTMAARNGGIARALVAAKIFYFGVGGGIDNFLSILPQNELRAVVVWKTEDGGVGRVILEIVLA